MDYEFDIKNIFHMHFIKQQYQHISCWAKKQKSLNQIGGMVLQLIQCDISKKMSLGARKERLIHKAGHVSWVKKTACQKYIVVDGYTK